MSNRKAFETPASKPPRRRRRTAADARSARERELAREASLGPVERGLLGVIRGLAVELGRAPTAADVAPFTGLSERECSERMTRLGPLVAEPHDLAPRTFDCLVAIATLRERLAGSPSTREVSAEMQLSPGASRFHINRLVEFGLVTPPEVRLVLDLTPAGRALLPRLDAPLDATPAPVQGAASDSSSSSTAKGPVRIRRRRERQSKHPFSYTRPDGAEFSAPPRGGLTVPGGNEGSGGQAQSSTSSTRSGSRKAVSSAPISATATRSSGNVFDLGEREP